LVDLARKSKNYDESLKEVKEEIKRMDELLDALLLITRIEESVSLDKEENDIVKSLNSTLRQLAMEFDDKKIVLHQDVPSKLVKKVHKQGWESIMTNLLRNAFKYVPNE
jgi:signal transduction histidine kinase